MSLVTVGPLLWSAPGVLDLILRIASPLYFSPSQCPCLILCWFHFLLSNFNIYYS